MIDLDTSILQARANAAGWSEARAVSVAGLVAQALSLEIDYEPPDEEWIRFTNTRPGTGMLSARLPLALVTRQLESTVRDVADDIVVVVIEGFSTEELRATPHLLRSTLLPDGWDFDFNTESFSANDLFVEVI